MARGVDLWAAEIIRIAMIRVSRRLEQAVNLAVPMVADACAERTWYDAKD